MRKLLVFAVLIAVTGVVFAIGKYDSYLASREIREAERIEAKRKSDSITYAEYIYRTSTIPVFRYLAINPDIKESESGLFYEIDKQGNRDKIDKELLSSILRKNNYDFTGDLSRTYTFYDGENKEDSKITIKTIFLDSIVAGRVFEWLPEAAQILGEGGEGVFYITYDFETKRLVKKPHALKKSIIIGWDFVYLNVLTVKPDEINVEASFINVEIDECLSLYDQGKIWQDENRPPKIINF